MYTYSWSCHKGFVCAYEKLDLDLSLRSEIHHEAVIATTISIWNGSARARGLPSPYKDCDYTFFWYLRSGRELEVAFHPLIDV